MRVRGPIGAPPSVIHAMRPVNLDVTTFQGRNHTMLEISTESTASLTAEVTTEFKVLCCSLSASLTPLAIGSSRSSLEMVESLNFFFIGDCPISLFRSPLTVEVFMMGLMQMVWNLLRQDNKISDKVSRAKDYACIEGEGSRQAT